MAAKPIYKNPIFLVGAIGAAIAGYVMTEPETKKTSGSNPAPRKKKADVRTGVVVFTEEDEKASFSRATSLDRNAFQPGVARHNGIGGADGRANALPTDITGGEANWVYTGNAEIDGVATALLENRSTGEGVFLRRGERWKSASVISIRENSIVLRGPSGTRTFTTLDDDPGMPNGSAPRIAQNDGGQGFNRGNNNNNNNGFSPMNPGIRGPIGQLPGVSANNGGGGSEGMVTFGDGQVMINGN